jgi:hypothetical protein
MHSGFLLHIISNYAFQTLCGSPHNVCNDEGKLLNLPLNRALRDSTGCVYDIVAGTFFLCAAPADKDNFASLTEEQAQTCLKRFAVPEQFIQVGDAVFVLPAL